MPVRPLAELAANQVAKNAEETLANSDEFTQSVARQNVSAKYLAISWFSRTDEERRLQESEACHRIAALDPHVPIDPEIETGLRMIVYNSARLEIRRAEARLNGIALVHMDWPVPSLIRMSAELGEYLDENPDGFTSAQIRRAEIKTNLAVNYYRLFVIPPTAQYVTAFAAAADAAA
jgi:hypothetical protein